MDPYLCNPNQVVQAANTQLRDGDGPGIVGGKCLYNQEPLVSSSIVNVTRAKLCKGDMDGTCGSLSKAPSVEGLGPCRHSCDRGPSHTCVR